jgi:hydroxymethylbilane synthase
MKFDTNTKSLIRIGTRGSKLALAQAHELRSSLEKANDALNQPNSIEIVVIKTTGDKIQDRSLAEIGGKGLFMKEIEQALLDNKIDIALHSMKDVETELTSGTELACILPREEINEAFLSNTAQNLDELKYSAKVGTSSVRRAALLKNKRPDLIITLFRGNVETRLSKLDKGEVDATLLAVAGLKRLNLEYRITKFMSLDEMPPAVAQGAIGAQCRMPVNSSDQQLWAWLDTVNHKDSSIQIEAERAMLATLDGSCQTPIAGYAKLHGDDQLTLTGFVVSSDGARIYKARETGSSSDATRLGQVVGRRLRAESGSDFPN